MRTNREGRGSGPSRESFRDRIRRRSKERRSGNQNLNLPEGMEMYRPKKSPRGDSARIDVLPYKVTAKDLGYAQPGDMWYEKTYYVHFQVGGGNGRCVCPNWTLRRKCPICEYAANLQRQPKTPENEEQIKKLRPKQRQLFNVIVLDESNKGVQIHENAFFNFGKELEKELNETEGNNPEYGDFASLKEGFTLKVRWDEEQQGGGRPYLKAGRIDFIERKRPYTKEILAETVNLDEALVILSYEEIERMFNGVDDEEEDTHQSKKQEDDEPRAERDRKKEEEEDKVEEDKVEEDEDEEDEENSDREVKYLKPKKKKSMECPVDGKFGKDWDKFEECEDCKIWGECKEDYKENHRKPRR